MCDTIVHMSGPALTTFSFLLWTIVFGLVAGALWSRKYERYLEVANWIVSSMHAIVTTGVGILIVKNTRHDLIYAKCALTGTTTFPEKRKRKLLTESNHHRAFLKLSSSGSFSYCIYFSRSSCIRIGRIFWTRFPRAFLSSVAKNFKGSQECREIDIIVQSSRRIFCTYRLTCQKFLKSALTWHHILILTVALPIVLGKAIFST